MPLLLTASADQSDQTAEPLLIALCGARDHSWQLCTEGEYSCGSSPADDIRIELSGIERGHCRLVYRAGQLWVQRGEGRIWVHELPVGSIARLCEGDTLSLGGVSLRFEGVVTAWIRGGRRQPAAPEQLEAATPKVQFIGHSHMPFGRLGSVLAPVAATTTTAPQQSQIPRHILEELSAKESRLATREQAVSDAEASIARILDELERVRNAELSTRQELERQSSLREDQTARLHLQLTSLEQRKSELEQQALVREQQVAELLRQLNGLEQRKIEFEQQASDREQQATELLHQLTGLELRKTELEQHTSSREQRATELLRQLTGLEQRKTELEQHTSIREQQATENLTFSSFSCWREISITP